MAKSYSENEPEIQSDHGTHKKIKFLVSEEQYDGEVQSTKSDVTYTGDQTRLSPKKSKKVSHGSQNVKHPHVSSSNSDDTEYSHRAFLDTNRVSKRNTHTLIDLD